MSSFRVVPDPDVFGKPEPDNEVTIIPPDVMIARARLMRADIISIFGLPPALLGGT